MIPGDGLQAWHAVRQWFKPRPVVEQAASMARLISPKRTKNVNELQVAVMQRELTLVEHESKFSEVVADSVKTAAMRAMLPKDTLERFLDGPFHCEELRNRLSAHVGEQLAEQNASGGAQRMDSGQIDKSEGEDEDVTAIQQRRPHDRSNQKHKQMSDNERTPFNRRTANSSPSAASRLHDKKSGSDETKQSAGTKKRLISYRCGGNCHPARLCPSADDCQDVDGIGTEPSSDADSDPFGLDWRDDPITTINSVTERNDRTRGGKELLAFVDSVAVDNVLPKSVCTEYPLEATSKSQSGVGFKGANGSRIKHYGQRRFRVKTSAGSNMNTTWEVADVRKPLISASRLLERGHKLVLDEKPRIQCKNGDSIRRTVVQVGLNTNRIMKRKPVRPYTEGRTRNTHAVWAVTDAFDQLDVDTGEPVDPDGLGGTARVLAAPRTPTKAAREEHDVSHVLCRPWCRFCVMGRGLERRHLTQSGDRDDDRPRVCADYGYLSGDSTPLLGMTFAAAVSMIDDMRW